MATAATRQEKNLVQQKYKRIDLTPTGLLMEAYSAQNPWPGILSEMGINEMVRRRVGLRLGGLNKEDHLCT
jgi:hypothetical protein